MYFCLRTRLKIETLLKFAIYAIISYHYVKERIIFNRSLSSYSSPDKWLVYEMVFLSELELKFNLIFLYIKTIM